MDYLQREHKLLSTTKVNLKAQEALGMGIWEKVTEVLLRNFEMERKLKVKLV